MNPAPIFMTRLKIYANVPAGRMERHQDGATISEVLAHRPVADSTVLLRELASIYRQVRRRSCHSRYVKDELSKTSV